MSLQAQETQQLTAKKEVFRRRGRVCSLMCIQYTSDCHCGGLGCKEGGWVVMANKVAHKMAHWVAYLVAHLVAHKVAHLVAHLVAHKAVHKVAHWVGGRHAYNQEGDCVDSTLPPPTLAIYVGHEFRRLCDLVPALPGESPDYLELF